jgi:hypothetical protein
VLGINQPVNLICLGDLPFWCKFANIKSISHNYAATY